MSVSSLPFNDTILSLITSKQITQIINDLSGTYQAIPTASNVFQPTSISTDVYSTTQITHITSANTTINHGSGAIFTFNNPLILSPSSIIQVTMADVNSILGTFTTQITQQGNGYCNIKVYNCDNSVNFTGNLRIVVNILKS